MTQQPTLTLGCCFSSPSATIHYPPTQPSSSFSPCTTYSYLGGWSPDTSKQEFLPDMPSQLNIAWKWQQISNSGLPRDLPGTSPGGSLR
ncbi:hypothetical protein BO82DRAFT_93537 [Aspergillus uvarum CBS 121591]|uniref:Uncharacterized protein n=1 Tax=Aspergillus uvarum CBS 121591 TaxID=1448315 RepID=A0A319CB38_9EURO|nr:hypothetical protein BO82DRAFT_93537 [Aspergillus uvarum CBS 121591]PYH81319.1 hypothetical protein BO82DRAFT_93537 [Aspergillus uvarum CBS 121591]